MGAYTDLRERLIAEYGAMSPQLQRAARYMLDHPDDVALKSMRALALSADVPPSTIVRLMKTIGIDGYQEFRLGYQNRLRDMPASYAGRARQLQHRGVAGEMTMNHGDVVSGDENALIDEILDQEHGNLARSYSPEMRAALIAACAHIEGARRVFVLGRRGAFPAAFQFAYAYRLFGDNLTLVDGAAGTFGDQLRGMGRRDVMLAVCLSPYTNDTLQMVDYALAQKSTIINVTDSDVSPIARHASVNLVVSDASPSFFQSFTAAVSVMQALVTLLVARGGETALQQIAVAEKQLSVFDTYWQDSGPKRNNRS
ncbi:MurR/RpiR family transcriptional regulator [Thalassospira alkalitolerans]|uniref:Transcriptional regulator n=1 Tax=Thalassospira alkalitolerans TaxID=1293890 RepID=A0A1Y2LER8_9PROT|nr:MurR/RpiR family transcriptional regulator [Thalassospira alkalitolerans]OSQ49569.1 transcriptional regulator [Thalassospira alkalitolerans]|tara:strand:- start:71633 stop:72568 length:936 start_codon:yes stop_codon:yes gene_type:complete